MRWSGEDVNWSPIRGELPPVCLRIGSGGIRCVDFFCGARRLDRSCGELAGGGELVQSVCVAVLIRVLVFGIDRLIMVRKKESKKHHGVSRGDGRVGKDGGGGGRGAANHKASSSSAGGKLTQLTCTETSRFCCVLESAAL
jgi:hypothetical protein